MLGLEFALHELINAVVGGLIGGGIAYGIAAWRLGKTVDRMNHNDRQVGALLADLFRRVTGDKRGVHVDRDGYLRVRVPLQPDDVSQNQSTGESRVEEK